MRFYQLIKHLWCHETKKGMILTPMIYSHAHLQL